MFVVYENIPTEKEEEKNKGRGSESVKIERPKQRGKDNYTSTHYTQNTHLRTATTALTRTHIQKG
jgi:hypothetical protein